MADNNNTNWRQFALAILLAVIATTPPTLMALATLNKSTETHDLVNSRMTEMLTVVKAAATATATLKERDRQATELPNRIDKEAAK